MVVVLGVLDSRRERFNGLGLPAQSLLDRTDQFVTLDEFGYVTFLEDPCLHLARTSLNICRSWPLVACGGDAAPLSHSSPVGAMRLPCRSSTRVRGQCSPSRLQVLVEASNGAQWLFGNMALPYRFR